MCGGVGLINLGQCFHPQIADTSALVPMTFLNICRFAQCRHGHHHDLVAGCMCVSVVGSRAGVSFSSITHTTGHTNTIMAMTMMVMSPSMMIVMLLPAMMMSFLMKVSATTISSRVSIALITKVLIAMERVKNKTKNNDNVIVLWTNYNHTVRSR